MYECYCKTQIKHLLFSLKTTAAQNEVSLSYHRVRGLYFLAAISSATIV